MTAAIFLKDRVGVERPKAVENFTFDIDKDGLNTVKARLLELQKGYCEGANDKPKIGMHEIKNEKTGKKIKTIYAESEVDFFYIAYLGMIVKTLNPTA